MSVIRRLYENGTITIVPFHRHHGKPPGNKGNKKTFRLSSGRKRLIECSSIRMWYNKKYSLKWGCLTFSTKVDHKEANKCLSKFLENLKQNYKLNSYVITKELHKSGNPHYHFIFDIPFTDFRRLNNSWCNACSSIMPYSFNALTTGRKPVIKDIKGVINYITKYISKADNIKISETRNYFIDHNTLSNGKIIDYNDYLYLISKFKSKTIVKDKFTIVYLKKFAFLPEKIITDYKKKTVKPKKIPDSLPYNFDFYSKIPEKLTAFYDIGA